MICPHCARSYDTSILFCPYDGARLLEQDEATSASFLSERTMVTSRELAPGVRVGEYRLEQQIGEGGMATVFRAVHPFSGKRVAIKILHPRLPSEVEAVTRFIQEARAVNEIGHRNIIDVISFEQMPDGRHFIVMEYLEGVTLKAWLEEHGAMSLDRVFPILRALASALDTAHARGFLHRDLKPENIFLERADDPDHMMVKLLDFGLAKRLASDGNTEDDWLHTRTGVVLGTPDYMSPEQCRGDPVDHRTDLYSLGVIAYQMLTGELPFQGESRFEVMAKRLKAPPPAPSHLSPLVSPAFDAPLLRALERDPQARFQSGGALVAALEAAAAERLEATSGLTGLGPRHPWAPGHHPDGLTPTAVPMGGATPAHASRPNMAPPPPGPSPSRQAGPPHRAAGPESDPTLDAALAEEATEIRPPSGAREERVPPRDIPRAAPPAAPPRAGARPAPAAPDPGIDTLKLPVHRLPPPAPQLRPAVPPGHPAGVAAPPASRPTRTYAIVAAVLIVAAGLGAWLLLG